MIKIEKYSDLDASTKAKLNEFIHTEFGHIPIVQETEWAQPDWTLISYKEGEITSFYNIIDRNVEMDGVEVRIAGVNNVITPKKYRGQGYGTKLLNETRDFIFDSMKAELGILLCADALIPFYERLNWYLVKCPVHFRQSDGQKLWQANTMVLNYKVQLTPQLINLNGLPW